MERLLAGCPACGRELDARGTRLFCDDCAGVMVTAAELADMLREIHPRDTRALEQRLRAPTESAAAARRTCPQCAARMDAFDLDGIPIDRCVVHGYWFDRDELAGVLQGDTSPAQFAAAHEQRMFLADSFELGLGGALAVRLFRLLRRRRRDGRS